MNSFEQIEMAVIRWAEARKTLPMKDGKCDYYWRVGE